MVYFARKSPDKRYRQKILVEVQAALLTWPIHFELIRLKICATKTRKYILIGKVLWFYPLVLEASVRRNRSQCDFFFSAQERFSGSNNTTMTVTKSCVAWCEFFSLATHTERPCLKQVQKNTRFGSSPTSGAVSPHCFCFWWIRLLRPFQICLLNVILLVSYADTGAMLVKSAGEIRPSRFLPYKRDTHRPVWLWNFEMFNGLQRTFRAICWHR